MRKPKLFIGSSTEELYLAEQAKTILENNFEVTVWNDNVWDSAVFKINNNFLADLLKASLKFDFGLLIGTTDDTVSYRGKEFLKPRDNVLFELGLFLGRLGISKSAFIVEKDLNILSDLQGISLARFDKSDKDSFDNAVNQVSKLFLSSSDYEINFFPSATLAAVYFENLIRPICKYLIENKGFLLNDHRFENCKLIIVIPERINEDINIQIQKMKSNFSIKSVSFKYSGRARNIDIDTKIENNTLHFLDFPTILTGINYSIENLLPNDFNILSPDYEIILERELGRFIETIKLLLLKNGFDDMVEIKKETDIK